MSYSSISVTWAERWRIWMIRKKVRLKHCIKYPVCIKAKPNLNNNRNILTLKEMERNYHVATDVLVLGTLLLTVRCLHRSVRTSVGSAVVLDIARTSVPTK